MVNNSGCFYPMFDISFFWNYFCFSEFVDKEKVFE